MNLSEETHELIVLILSLAHMAVIILKSIGIITVSWWIVLLPEIMFPLVCIATAIYVFLLNRRC